MFEKDIQITTTLLAGSFVSVRLTIKPSTETGDVEFCIHLLPTKSGTIESPATVIDVSTRAGTSPRQHFDMEPSTPEIDEKVGTDTFTSQDSNLSSFLQCSTVRNMATADDRIVCAAEQECREADSEYVVPVSLIETAEESPPILCLALSPEFKSPQCNSEELLHEKNGGSLTESNKNETVLQEEFIIDNSAVGDNACSSSDPEIDYVRSLLYSIITVVETMTMEAVIQTHVSHNDITAGENNSSPRGLTSESIYSNHDNCTNQLIALSNGDRSQRGHPLSIVRAHNITSPYSLRLNSNIPFDEAAASVCGGISYDNEPETESDCLSKLSAEPRNDSLGLVAFIDTASVSPIASCSEECFSFAKVATFHSEMDDFVPNMSAERELHDKIFKETTQIEKLSQNSNPRLKILTDCDAPCNNATNTTVPDFGNDEVDVLELTTDPHNHQEDETKNINSVTFACDFSQNTTGCCGTLE